MSLYLLAILPPEEIDRKVHSWKEHMLNRYGCRVALKSPAHITLIPPFCLGDDKVEALTDLLKVFAKRFNRFDIHLKNFSAFAPRVIYVHVEENNLLEQLKNALEQAMITNGYPVRKEDRPFHPHVTIANRDLSKQDFPEAWKHFQHLSYQAAFKTEAITLLKHNGQTWTRLADAMLP